MTHDAHHPRPADLVALVSFDGNVYENQAVTREHLGHANPPPHILAAAIEQWLRRGRQTWIDVRGRQIHGVATAREVSTQGTAWEIDTLVDAGDADADGAEPGGADRGEVTAALLRRATEAAIEAKATRVLLRLAADAQALPAALRAGFAPAAAERLWSGSGLVTPASVAATGTAGYELRPLEDRDRHDQFRLYNRAVPVECRQTLAVTFEEWSAVQEHRWLGRRALASGAFQAGELRATLHAHPGGNGPQLALVVEPQARAAAGALLAQAAEQLAGAGPVLALVPRFATVAEAILSDAGLTPGDEYVLLAKRTTETVAERVRARSSVPITS